MQHPRPFLNQVPFPIVYRLKMAYEFTLTFFDFTKNTFKLCTSIHYVQRLNVVFLTKSQLNFVTFIFFEAGEK